MLAMPSACCSLSRPGRRTHSLAAFESLNWQRGHPGPVSKRFDIAEASLRSLVGATVVRVSIEADMRCRLQGEQETRRMLIRELARVGQAGAARQQRAGQHWASAAARYRSFTVADFMSCSHCQTCAIFQVVLRLSCQCDFEFLAKLVWENARNGEMGKKGNPISRGPLTHGYEYRTVLYDWL